MSSAKWVVAVIFGMICVLGVVGLPKLWRHETRMWDGKAPAWWVWGEAFFRGWVRGLVVGTLAAVFLLLAFLVGELTGIDDRDRARGAADVAFGATVVLLTLSMLLFLRVVLFNWPKAVVPPHLRNEPGAVANWRRRRSRD